MEFPIQCFSCGATGSVSRVTAGLQCKCGSTDIDLYDDAKTAASQQGHHTWLTQGQWPEEDPEYDDGEVHLPDHLQHTYDTGYNRGRAGQSPMHGFQSEHQDAHDLGFEHGQRDRGYDQRRQAAAHGRGEGWDTPRSDPTSNWNEYAGPTPKSNPNITRKNDADESHVCQICHGTGKTSIGGGGYDESTCRNCHGTGRVVYSTENDRPSLDAHMPGGNNSPGSAGSHGHFSSRAKVTMPDGTTYFLPLAVNAGRTSTDPMGSAEDYIRSSTPGYGDDTGKEWRPSKYVKVRPEKEYSHGDEPIIQLNQANCPNCGHRPTQLLKDHKDQAWWHCPSCGPLANVDKNPHVNPFSPPEDFTPDRGFKSRSGLFNRKSEKDGKIFAITASILNNNALSVEEALTLAREALIRFPEGQN